MKENVFTFFHDCRTAFGTATGLGHISLLKFYIDFMVLTHLFKFFLLYQPMGKIGSSSLKIVKAFNP